MLKVGYFYNYSNLFEVEVGPCGPFELRGFDSVDEELFTHIGEVELMITFWEVASGAGAEEWGGGVCDFSTCIGLCEFLCVERGVPGGTGVLLAEDEAASWAGRHTAESETSVYCWGFGRTELWSDTQLFDPFETSFWDACELMSGFKSCAGVWAGFELFWRWAASALAKWSSRRFALSAIGSDVSYHVTHYILWNTEVFSVPGWLSKKRKLFKMIV